MLPCDNDRSKVFEMTARARRGWWKLVIAISEQIGLCAIAENRHQITKLVLTHCVRLYLSDLQRQYIDLRRRKLDASPRLTTTCVHRCSAISTSWRCDRCYEQVERHDTDKQPLVAYMTLYVYRQCLNWAGTHRNAIPALFGKAERHTGTSGDARGGTLG